MNYKILYQLSEAVEVLVLADRGIGTSPDLCRAVAGIGWHYGFSSDLSDQNRDGGGG